MAWSIFQQGGGAGAAVTWAQDLLKSLNVPQSAANVQFIYDWEVSEGGGGENNPLNVGPYGGLATSGQQYGGGAANYPSLAANIEADTELLNTSTYKGIVTALSQSNYSGAEQALWNSPWAASHYGYGADWSTSTPPGATPINLGGTVAGVTTTAATDPFPFGNLDPLNWPFSLGQAASNALIGNLGSIGKKIETDLWEKLKPLLIRLGLILMGAFLVYAGATNFMKEGSTTTDIITSGGKKAAEGMGIVAGLHAEARRRETRTR